MDVAATPRPGRCRALLRGTLVAGWGALAVAGFIALASIDAVPAPEDDAPERWPAESRLRPAEDRPSLLVFLHPRCPCSRATAAQLERLLAGRTERVSARAVLATWPGDGAADAGGLRTRLESVTGLEVVEDPEGVEAARFGATASGAALFYDATGRLRFRGGLTPTRGHVGPSAGADAVEALLCGRGPSVAAAPVFGCGLVRPEVAR